MNVQIIRGAEVNRPTPAPLTSSVLAHATVVEKADFGVRNNAGMWPSYNCLDLLIPTPVCPDPMLSETGDAKVFTTAGWVPGFEFAVYGGVQCSAVGLDKADQKAETARVFGLSEGKGVEQALLLNRFVATDSDAPVQWEDPEDLGAAPSLTVALGILESYAAAVYAGQPTLHMPRGLVTMGFGMGLFTVDGDKFLTKTGAKVAVGGGYDSPDPLDPVKDIFVTGEVYVERTDTISVQSYVIPGDGSGIGSGENGLADNTVVSFAERLYRVAIDCLVAKVSATLWTA
jgi:hypothetical protein